MGTSIGRDRGVRAHAYLVAHFVVVTKLGGPPDIRCAGFRIFSEPHPTTMGREFYALLWENEGATYAEAIANLRKFVALRCPELVPLVNWR